MDLTGALAEEIRSAPGTHGFSADGVTATESDRVLAVWTGVQNLEELLVSGRPSSVVLRHLRRLDNVPG